MQTSEADLFIDIYILIINNQLYFFLFLKYFIIKQN